MHDRRVREEVTQRAKWMRLIYIVIYAVLFQLAELVLAAIVVIQFLWHLFAGAPNENLRDLGHRIGAWLGQTVHYVTYASDERPWPFGRPWPDAADLPPRQD